HARSLDRYLASRLRGPARLLRPLLPIGLAAWVLLGTVAARVRPGASSTGELRSGTEPTSAAPARGPRPVTSEERR
ncbi:MAG: hypothetical protein ACLFUG_11770, partial [Nitriliruptoraceae bacterium]